MGAMLQFDEIDPTARDWARNLAILAVLIALVALGWWPVVIILILTVLGW